MTKGELMRILGKVPNETRVFIAKDLDKISIDTADELVQVAVIYSESTDKNDVEVFLLL